MKLLVVEDELYAREELVRQIQRYDTEHQFEILQAANGEEGLNICREQRPELVLTDIRMPKMDGLEMLEQIRRENLRTKVVALSAYSDFEYARSALTNGASGYLLKPISDETLSDCLDQFLRQRQSEQKEEFLSGRDMATQYILKCIRKTGGGLFVEQRLFGRLFPVWQMGVICFGKPGRTDPDCFCQEMEALCGSKFWTRFRFLEAEAGLWILVLTPDEENLFLWRRIRKILETCGTCLGIGVSRRRTKANGVADAYQEALTAMKCKIYTGETLVFAEKISWEEYTEYYLPQRLDEKLESELEEGTPRRVQGVIDRMFQEMEAHGKVKPECLDLLYSQILLRFRRAVGADDLQKEPGKAAEDIRRFHSLEEMRDYLKRIAESICQMKQSARQKRAEGGSSGSEIVEKMMDYVRRNYSRDVTVRDLAEKELFMNQSYVSHLFVEKTGISFSAFLRRVRIDHAKELLAKGAWSVTEVGSMVGYNDTSQFIRIFRQETGMTPKKYCRYMRESQEL